MSRNVQLTGAQSFTITLPKPWIRSNNIQPKQPLYMRVEDDGTLVIQPRLSTQNKKNTVVMSIGPQINQDLLFRSILSQYCTGRRNLKILGNGKFSLKTLETIKQLVFRVEKFNITFESLNSVYLEVDDSSMIDEFPQIVKSMGKLTNKTLLDVQKLLNTQNSKLYNSILKREKEINQDLWKIAHIANLLFSNPDLYNRSLTDINHIYSFCLNLEQIADSLKYIADNVMKISKGVFPLEIKSQIYSCFDEIKKILDDGLRLIPKRDLNAANSLITYGESLQVRCETLLKFCTRYSDIIIPLFKIVENLSVIGKKFRNIGEILFVHKG